MKSILMVACIASISAQAGMIGITYSFAGAAPGGPPVIDGPMLTVDGIATGSFLSGDPALNATWNPVTYRDHAVVDLTIGLLNGTFSFTFANGDILSGNLFEDVSALVANGMGPFTQILTFTGGTGNFAGASGSASGAGFLGTTAFMASGSGTLTAPGISAIPEPASVALIFGGLLVMAASSKRVRDIFDYERKKTMQRQMKNLLYTFSLALGIISAAFGQGGTFTAIDFPAATATLAWSINKSGDVAGSYTIAGVTHAFKLTGGRFTTIDYPGATSTDARGINNRGDISGIYNAGGVSHGFVLSGDKFTALDFPNASSTLAWGINSSGDVVGNYTAAGAGHGFKWSGGQFTTIDFPGSTVTNLTGINSQGEISGIYTLAGSTHAFLLSDGEFTSLDVPGSDYTNSTALTSHGDIIGRYTAGTAANGYLLRRGAFSTIAVPNATFTGAAAINERGDIVGRYQTADSTTAFHAFLLSGFQPACVAYVPQIAVTSGAAAVTHASDFKLVTAANPAAPGELLSLFTAGLGPTRPGVDLGKPFPLSPLAVVTSPVEVRANGTLAEVLGAVGLPGTVDGYQVNFRLPAGALKGLASLQVSTGTVADTSVKITVK